MFIQFLRLLPCLSMLAAAALPASAFDGGRRSGNRVTAGEQHSCAIKEDGSVQCWGNNLYGQLGDGTFVNRPTPATVSGLANALSISAGLNHTCALLMDGTVWCWGYNNNGQLGDGTVITRNAPVVVPALAGATSVAAGASHTCTSVVGGEARCWGLNNRGQLGDGTTVNRTAPVTVQAPGGPMTKRVSVVAGENHSCALGESGQVRCWGDNAYGQIAQPAATLFSTTALDAGGLTGAKALAAGLHHTCVARFDGTMRCWGRNQNGRLGNGAVVNAYAPVTTSSGAQTVKGLSAGGNHTCLLRADGSVQCWGSNLNGQLGDATFVAQTTPATSVSGLPNFALEIASGKSHGCARQTDGSVKCWGANAGGQVGDGTLTDRNTATGAVATAPATIADSVGIQNLTSCAAMANGSVSCWGYGFTNAPATVAGLSNAAAISPGWDSRCVLSGNGTVSCWGANLYGQLGNGTFAAVIGFVQVSNLTDAISVSSDNYHRCAVRARGTIMCWGRNDYGQLGDGTTTDASAPVQVSGLTDAVAVAVGKDHSCALRVTGAVSCWGNNSYGALGDGTTTQRLTPVSSGVIAAVAIAAGRQYTCAARAGGTPVCWGDNWYGQLGDGTNNNFRTTSTPVSGLTQTVRIAAGDRHTCSLDASGNLRCWGNNMHGRIGDGTTTSRLTSVSVLTGQKSVSLADAHSCSVAGNSQVSCWGFNLNGTVGDGTNIDRWLPVGILF